ncbi:aminotransferase class I/II-fold pyridoxal phosphate-dependent enzyme [Candidatus Micrarchaeota archaeon]|nr:aminotransferase class I/II-fold pyridoxal phosphate-dependent enzyme [Candidatus Micrarchaeota archaeon]
MQIGSNLFNENIGKGGKHTLRRTDVKWAENLAREFGRRIIDSQLGDPTMHGLPTYGRLNSIHTKVCIANEIRSAITETTQGQKWADTKTLLEGLLGDPDPVEATCRFLTENVATEKKGTGGEGLAAKARIIGEKRLVPLLQEYCKNPLAPTETSYHNSSGNLRLRKILAKRSGLKDVEGIDENCVFIGRGVSGIVEALYKTILKPMESGSQERILGLGEEIKQIYPEIEDMLGERKKETIWKTLKRRIADILQLTSERPEVIVPDACYPLYVAEGTFAGAKLVNVKMHREDGQLDLVELEKKITRHTRAVNLITVGNPIGVGMKREVFQDALRIINEKAKDFGRPIFVVCDTIYEPYRENRNERIEPLEVHRRMHDKKDMSHIVVIDVSSMSKMAAIPGQRVGWAKVSWLGDTFAEERTRFLDYMVSVLNPQLTSTAMDWQIAVAELFERLESDTELKADYERFKAARAAECRRRTRGFIEDLMEINRSVIEEFGVADAPIVFHPSYRLNGSAKAASLDNWYVVFGFNERYVPRDLECSGARRLAEFAAWSGELGAGYAVPVFTPGSNFPFLVDEKDTQDYMRAVALFSDEKREDVKRTITAFSRLIVEAYKMRSAGTLQ